MWTKEARIQHAPREERYPSDVTDAEWAIISPIIPPPRRGWAASRDRHAGGHERGALRGVRDVNGDSAGLLCVSYVAYCAITSAYVLIRRAELFVRGLLPRLCRQW